MHMARKYGVTVKAFNISKDQLAYARARVKEEGLHHRVEFIEDDYRNVRGKFDVFVSVGMLEHVGRSHYKELSNVIHRTIGTCGRGLLHFVGRNRPSPLNNWIRRRIFPGAYPPALREVMPMFEHWDYAVIDVENLRRHYELTLQRWLERFEQAVPVVRDRFDESFVRMWRLYLAGSVAAFRTGALQLFQVLFAGPACQTLPSTRDDIYLEAHQSAA
jgi:cyclopropane-fatty-acyl-phospholipid synthase